MVNFSKVVLGLAAVLVVTTAHAHDPSEHKKGAEKPDCAALAQSNRSAMDMNDPIMQAMRKQCMDEYQDDKKEERHHHEKEKGHHGDDHHAKEKMPHDNHHGEKKKPY
jgi:hypothetical protein